MKIYNTSSSPLPLPPFMPTRRKVSEFDSDQISARSVKESIGVSLPVVQRLRYRIINTIESQKSGGVQDDPGVTCAQGHVLTETTYAQDRFIVFKSLRGRTATDNFIKPSLNFLPK